MAANLLLSSNRATPELAHQQPAQMCLLFAENKTGLPERRAVLGKASDAESGENPEAEIEATKKAAVTTKSADLPKIVDRKSVV